MQHHRSRSQSLKIACDRCENVQGLIMSLTYNFSNDKQNKTHKPNNTKFAKAFKSARFV